MARPSLVTFGEDKSTHVEIESTGCLYHCRSQTDGLIDQRFLPQVTWKGTENCYSGDLYTVREVGPNGEWIGVKEQGLEAWRKLWPEPEQNSRELQRIRLAFGDSQRTGFGDRQSKVQPPLDNWRIRANLRDNGPEWSLIGPGDAYVRALKAEGQSIEDGDLLTQPPTDGPCVLIRDKTVQRGYVPLQEVVDAAISGDVIEIRKSGQLAGCTIQGESRLLTLRAGLGYQPVINSVPLRNSGSDRLILEGLTIDTTVFASEAAPPANWNGSDPASPLFPGQGAIVRVKNCRVRGSIYGWFDALDGVHHEILNTESYRLILGVRPGKQAQIFNSMAQTVTVETESATSNPATLQVSHCAVFAPFPDLYTIHSAFVAYTPMRLDVQDSSLTAARQALSIPQASVTWNGARNIYRIAGTFSSGRLPHDGNWHSAVREEGSIQFVPVEFGPAAWKIVPHVSPGYERRLDGKDFGVDVERLTRAVDEWYAE